MEPPIVGVDAAAISPIDKIAYMVVKLQGYRSLSEQ